jgi:hypothetical protein
MSLHLASRRYVAGVVVCLGALAGCSENELPKLIDYLEEIEFDIPLDTAEYVTLGQFDIPIAAAQRPVDGPKQFVFEDGEWMRLRFSLAAETTPEQAKQVAAAAETHRGALSDALISVIRTSSVDELADPRYFAIRARLTDVARPMLGEGSIRQLVFNEFDADTLENAEPAAAHEEAHGHH